MLPEEIRTAFKAALMGYTDSIKSLIEFVVSQTQGYKSVPKAINTTTFVVNDLQNSDFYYANNSGGLTVTIKSNTDTPFSDHFECRFLQLTSGQINFVSENSSVELVGLTQTTAEGQVVTLKRLSINRFVIF